MCTELAVAYWVLGTEGDEWQLRRYVDTKHTAARG